MPEGSVAAASQTACGSHLEICLMAVRSVVELGVMIAGDDDDDDD